MKDNSTGKDKDFYSRGKKMFDEQARVDVITVHLVREGINKHRARELANHFVNLTLTPPLPVQPTPVQEPVEFYHLSKEQP